ncbi:MAG: nucleoside deaminase [Chthonomonadales bacterium]|nr:nucleoside deaminase [Chthonomonadales bacterium]
MPALPSNASRLMGRCRELAAAARDRGDPPVGAVIARSGHIIAEAGEQVVTRCDVTAHAELLAIRLACQALGATDLSDCTLYTSVEPCWMCSYAIREARIGQVVIAEPIEAIGGVTSRHAILLDDGVAEWGPPPSIAWWGR